MSEDFGSDFITVTDDDGQEFELEVLDYMDFEGETFAAFLPADMDEDDPDYGIIILKVTPDENGMDVFESVDDEEKLDKVFDNFMRVLYDDEEEPEA